MIETKLGKGSTYDVDLANAGSSMFGKKFKGVFPSDKIPKLSKIKPYAIINVDPSYMPGSHWIAISYNTPTHLDTYDSFGRPVYKLIDKKNFKRKLIDSDRDSEQRKSEENCGPRSLAWLYIYDTFGRNNAMLI